MAIPPERRIYEFGEFRLDVEHLMLYRSGEELSLAPKAVGTLLALVERQGEIVSKDELLAAVWPDTIVEESNLFLYLSTLRKTLSTQKDGKPWVQTLHRRGYRFNGEVTVAAPAVREDTLLRPNLALANEPPPPSRTKIDWRNERNGRAPLLAYALVGIVTISIGIGSYAFFLSKRPIRSIAVMPSAAENPATEYFSEGVAEDLTDGLRNIPDLEVKASSTMARYKGTNVDAAEIGRREGVDAILVPRYAQRGDDFTLSLELVDPNTSNILFSKKYDRTAADLGVVRRDIIRDLVRELRVDLSYETKQKIAKRYSDNAEATALYSRGVYLIRKLNEAQIREGIAYLRQATEKDPSYAPAYAMIAAGVRSLTLCCDVDSSEQVEAMVASRKAIELDDYLAEAHSSLGAGMWQHDWNYQGAEEELRRAIDLDPGSAASHFSFGDFLGRMGEQSKAAAEFNRAAEIEPLSPFYNSFAAFCVEDVEEGIRKAKYARDLDPNFYFSHNALGFLYQRAGRLDEAEAELRKAKELAPEQTWTDANLSLVLIRQGRIAESRAILDELLARSRYRFVPPFHIAFVYNQLGEHEKALEWLEKAYVVRDPKLTFIQTIPSWRKFDTDPRFQDLKRRIGM